MLRSNCGIFDNEWTSQQIAPLSYVFFVVFAMPRCVFQVSLDKSAVSLSSQGPIPPVEYFEPPKVY